MKNIPVDILCDIFKNFKREEFEKFKPVNRQWRDIIEANESGLPLYPLLMIQIKKNYYFNPNKKLGLYSKCSERCNFGHHLSRFYTSPDYLVGLRNRVFMEYDITEGFGSKYLEVWKELYQIIGQKIKIHKVSL